MKNSFGINKTLKKYMGRPISVKDTSKEIANCLYPNLAQKCIKAENYIFGPSQVKAKFDFPNSWILFFLIRENKISNGFCLLGNPLKVGLTRAFPKRHVQNRERAHDLHFLKIRRVFLLP